MSNIEVEKSNLKAGINKVLSKFKSNIDKNTINIENEATNRNLQVVNFYQQQIEKNHLPEIEDPFIALGYGIVAFFTLLKSLILIFAVFSILGILQIVWYSGFPEGDYWNADWTLGGGTGTSYINKIAIPLASNTLYI